MPPRTWWTVWILKTHGDMQQVWHCGCHRTRTTSDPMAKHYNLQGIGMARGDVDQLSQPANMTLWCNALGHVGGKTDATSATKEHCYAKKRSPRRHGDHFNAFTIGPLTFAFPKFAYYLHHLRTMGPEALVFTVCVYYMYIKKKVDIYIYIWGF